MKKYLYILLFVCGFSFSQDFSQKKEKAIFFSFTPKNEKVRKVNGLAIGAGIDVFEEGSIKKINGLNIELNPLGIFYFMFANPTSFNEEALVTINGLNISGGNQNSTKVNGLVISFINISHASNGVSVNGTYTHVAKLNGLHVSGISNSSKISNGMFLSLFNDSESLSGFQLGLTNRADIFKGLQVSIVNRSKNSTGVQIGLFNLSKVHKGLQIAFWNSNDKRSMPFINW